MVDMYLKTIDNNMGDSLLNDSGYLKEDGVKRKIDQKKLESFSTDHHRNSNYNQIDLNYLNKLFLEALKNEKKFIEKDSSLQATTVQEQWLAPRIHYGLRLTRSEAANPEIWNYLALKFDTYVARRWTYDENGINSTLKQIPHENHFLFRLHSRHQIAKLWWMAEMTRNCGEYHEVGGIINTDMINYCLDITAPNFHPYIIAILKMEDDLMGDGNHKLDSPWLRSIFRIINRKIIHEGGVSKAHVSINQDEAKKWFNGSPDLKYTKFGSKLPPASKDICFEEKDLKKIISWLRDGINNINNSEWEHLRESAYKVLKKEKKPLSVAEIVKNGNEEDGLFEEDWQKKELGFALDIGNDKRMVKSGAKWELA